MDPVKFGIIGIGNMGSSHVKSIGELKNAILTAVCDIDENAFKRIDPAVAEKIAKFTDTASFFKKADVDAVIIAVPHYFHPELAIEAMKHGKHFIVEKPIGVHKAAAMEMIKVAKKYPKLKKAAMFNQRTIDAHRKIKNLIDSGELGEIRRVNWIITDWFRTQFYYDSGDWRASWRGEGGGVLLNQCPHQLDLMQWFFGMPKLVDSHLTLGKYHDIEVEDDVTAYLEYPNGATGVFIASTGETPGTNRLEITAERGRLVLENGKLSYLRNETPMAEFCKNSDRAFATPEKWIVEIPCRDGNPYQHRDIIENFAKAVQENTPLIAQMEEGINGLELGNAMLFSGLAKKPVTLPIDEKAFAERLEKLIAKSRYKKKAVAKKGSSEDFSSSFNK